MTIEANKRAKQYAALYNDRLASVLSHGLNSPGCLVSPIRPFTAPWSAPARRSSVSLILKSGQAGHILTLRPWNLPGRAGARSSAQTGWR